MRDLVRLAERRGYDSVWLPESHGREVLTELTALALSSERIRLGTGIIPVFMHLPTVTAAAMATAAVVAPGRVMLGVGIGHQANLESSHGVHFYKPLQHVREFVTLVRRVFAEGQVSYQGDIYTIKDFQLEMPPAQRVPVYIAALRPHMLQLAGAVADGVLMNWASLEYIPQAIAYIRQGADAAGRSLRDIHIALEQAWQRGDATAAAQAVTRPMLQALTIYGSAEECRRRLQTYRDAGLQLPIIAPFPIGEPVQETFARTIEACSEGR